MSHRRIVATLLTVFAADAFIRWSQRALGSRVARAAAVGLTDEVANAVTAALATAVLPRRAAASPVAAAVGSVALDLDHVPSVLAMVHRRPAFTRGRDWLLRKPAHHVWALVTAGITVLALPGATGRASRGVVLGLASHLVRDAATGGVRPLRPVAGGQVVLPYPAYAAALIGVAGLAWKPGPRRWPALHWW